MNSGILLYSNVTIYEVGNGGWANHTFIRTLTEYTDFISENNYLPNFFQTLAEFFMENWPFIMILGLIILGTIISIRRIHQNNIRRGFIEFKRFQKDEKLQSHKTDEIKKKKEHKN